MITNKITIFVAFLLTVFSVSTYAEESKSYFEAASGIPSSKKGKTYDETLTPDLVYRVAFGRASDVQILLDKNANPEARNTAGIPVLLIATIRKDEEAPKIAHALIKAGANVNKVAQNGNMAVIEAVRNGRPDVLQVLIDNRAVLAMVRDSENKTLLEIAEIRSNLEIVKILNAGLEKEKDKIQALKSQSNFIKLVQQYAFLSCANEYLNFYISTQSKDVNMVAFNDVITANSNELSETSNFLQSLFRMDVRELRAIQGVARGAIIKQMNYYETNQNRELNGIGTDADLNKRCTKIAQTWNAKTMNKDQYNRNVE